MRDESLKFITEAVKHFTYGLERVTVSTTEAAKALKKAGAEFGQAAEEAGIAPESE